MQAARENEYNDGIHGIASLQSTNLVKQKNAHMCVEERIPSTVRSHLNKKRKGRKKRAQSRSRRSQRKEVTGIANPDGREQVQGRLGGRKGVIVVWRREVATQTGFCVETQTARVSNTPGTLSKSDNFRGEGNAEREEPGTCSS